MIFRNLDESGDWTFGNGTGNYIDTEPAVSLNVETRLLSWVGDCFFDERAGIDWTNRLGNKNQAALLDLDLKRVILSSFGVVGLTDFSTQLTGRAFTANYSIDTIYTPSYQNSLTVGL